MGYRELIKKVQLYSGFSDAESKDALDLMVETLAVHLNEGGRKNFASQLPQELKGMALSVMPTEDNTKQDILHQFMEMQKVEEPRAKKQIMAAWRAIKEAISKGEIEHIKAQLSKKEAEMLY
jgi:uncharacterized protein (DUF2267 family)